MSFIGKVQLRAIKYLDNNSMCAEYGPGFYKLAAGEEPSISTGICGSTTIGYGRLDQYGYWECPLPNELVDWMKDE